MDNKYQDFGKHIWQKLTAMPLGSITKRELEILLINAGIQSNLVSDNPVNIASNFKLSLTRANTYLTDISLRNPIIDDREAFREIFNLLPVNEIITENTHLSIPINNASLRIWLERKIAQTNLNPGESLRRDLMKITPSGLYKILDDSDEILSPAKALVKLSDEYGHLPWFLAAQRNWTEESTWQKLLTNTSEIKSFAENVSTLVSFLMKVVSLSKELS